MYQPAELFQENRPICFVSSDAHRRTYIHTETYTHRPVGRCRVAYDHPAALIVLRSAYGLPAYRSQTKYIQNSNRHAKLFGFPMVSALCRPGRFGAPVSEAARECRQHTAT